MIHRSQYTDVCLPPSSVTLPLFLLGDVPLSSERAKEPVLCPAPSTSLFHATRPHAEPFSLVDVKERAYAVARGILAGRLGFPFTKGDVILVFSTNQHDYVPNVLGIALAGGVAALCNPAYRARELVYNLEITGAKAILTSDAPDVVNANNSITALQVAQESLTLYGQDLPIFCFEEERSDSWEKVYGPAPVTQGDIDAVNEKHSQTMSGNDLAILCFSSGTSGMPKAVSLSHGGLVANIIQGTFGLRSRMNTPLDDGAQYSPDGKTSMYLESYSARNVRLPAVGSTAEKSEDGGDDQSQENWQTPGRVLRADSAIDLTHENDEVHIDILPTFHCYGFMVQLIALHTCTPRVVLPRFHLATFLQCIQDFRATTLSIAPPIMLAFAKHPLIDKYDLSSLRALGCGAAPLATETYKMVEKRLRVRTVNGYGMTEMSPMCMSVTPEDVALAPGSIGRPAPNTRALIVRPDGTEVDEGEQGELLLQGPQMMLGYWKNEEATTKAFYIDPRDGSKWYRTGDVVYADQRGYLTITDRIKDVIKVKGFQVSPAELEGVLFEDSRVLDVAVVGILDGWEKPWAFVVPAASCSKVGSAEKELMSIDILAKANAQLAAYKKIQGLTWLDALPKSPAGKILKKDLPAMR